MLDFPQTFRIRQSLIDAPIADIQSTLQNEFSKLKQIAATKIEPGQTVAITVGSRGIANIAEITRQIVANVKSLGGQPFIVPAMGSHANADAQAQQKLIESYGVTEAFCGCPIRSSMNTVVVCQANEGFPVYFDEHAFNADHVIVCNRIKPHTSFSGAIESGLMKMMLIGLGKRDGAKIYHSAIVDYSFDTIVRSVARQVIKKCNILASVAIVEDGLDQTSHLEVVLPENIETREPELLIMAKQKMPRLPFEHLNVLLIDKIGKDISGTGLDTNIVGRKQNIHAASENELPQIRRIVVRGLSEKTHGNGTGIGIAELCHKRVVDAIDLEATRMNCATSGRFSVGMLPLSYETDKHLLSAALNSIGLTAQQDAKMLWIRDTLHLAEIECSTVFYNDAKNDSDLQIITEPRPLEFDSLGNLVDRF